MPSDFDKVEILFPAERKGILFIIAHNLNEWAQEMWCDGVLMVAKRLDNGDYAVAIWHELYGYALNHFRLRRIDGAILKGENCVRLEGFDFEMKL